jgi:uncharacterized protein (TIGR02284 family)
MDDTVKTLNELIAVCEDGEKEFAEGAEIAEDTKLQLLFRQFAEECRDAGAELRAAAIALGGAPASEGTVVGAVHRGWLKLKSTIEERNIAVLEELERGQERVTSMYRKTAAVELPANVDGIIRRQCDSTVARCERLRELCKLYKGGVVS